MRFIKSALVVIGVVFIILQASFSSAQSLAISNGLSYLLSSQTVTGYWGPASEASYNSFLDTCTVSDTLKSLNSTGPAYDTATQWINTVVVGNNDYLLAKFLSLSQAGMDVSSISDALFSSRNSDGGWGVTEGGTNDIKRTALALQALKAANYSDTTVLYQAINYLTTNQNSDGGWGFTSSGPSNAHVTAIVLRALIAYNSIFLIPDSINKASSYLLTKQNTNGGFGSSPSNAYETALSIISLIESGKGSIQQLQSAVTYLTSAQSTTNGSWNNDPYSTALALQALAKVRPNLAISSTGISFSDTMPQIGEAVTITANVRNAGLDSASSIVVRFYSGDPASSGVQLGADQIISSLAPNSSTPVSVTASFTDTGNRTIFAVADPDNLISETSKADNKTSARLWVATGPDLAVYSEDLIPSTYIPAAGTAFTLEYKVRNLGETEAGAFTVSLYDGDPSQNGTLLQTANISGIAGAEIRTVNGIENKKRSVTLFGRSY